MHKIKTKIKHNDFSWRSRNMKTYDFKVIVEADEERWHAYCPALKKQGASTWGFTEKEALKNIQEVVQLIVEELVEEGEKIPDEPRDQVQVFQGPRVAITV